MLDMGFEPEIKKILLEKLTDGRRDYGRLPMTKAHMAYGQVS
jgi:hypothetical protein